MKTKKFLAFLITVFVLTNSLSVSIYADQSYVTGSFSDINVTLNGESYDVKPFVISGTSYFPIRALGYAFNCNVEWNASTRTVTLTSQTNAVEKYTQSTVDLSTTSAVLDSGISVYADGSKVETGPVAVVNGATYIPVRTLADALNKNVIWDKDSKTIKIVSSSEIEALIQKYYVTDIPEGTKKKGDQFIGNWTSVIVGKNSNKGKTARVMYFISRVDDSTLKAVKIYELLDITADNEDYKYQEVGDYFAVEYKAYMYKQNTIAFEPKRALESNGVSVMIGNNIEYFEIKDDQLVYTSTGGTWSYSRGTTWTRF